MIKELFKPRLKVDFQKGKYLVIAIFPAKIAYHGLWIIFYIVITLIAIRYIDSPIKANMVTIVGGIAIGMAVKTALGYKRIYSFNNETEASLFILRAMTTESSIDSVYKKIEQDE